MNNPVNFETAKLLYEKGFDELCSHAYKEVENPVLYIHQDKKYNNSFKKEWQNTVRKNSQMNNAVIKRYSAPTIAEVVMWLYERHGIWIISDWSQAKWCYSIIDIKEETIRKVSGEKWSERSSGVYLNTGLDFKSPTEAYEAAIKYCLKEII